MASDYKKSSIQALVMSGGYVFLRDIIQFIQMIILIRILTPEEYGSFGLTLSIIGFISIFSAVTIISHSLQVRDYKNIDWQTYFTFGFLVNIFLFLLTNFTVLYLFLTKNLIEIQGPLAVMSLTFIIDTAATLRHNMLQSEHNWVRFRLILIISALLSAAGGILFGYVGLGVYSLAVAPILLSVPAVLDLFIFKKWRPNFYINKQNFLTILKFSISRTASSAFQKISKFLESSLIVYFFDYATLGIFGRALGLGNLILGRIGIIALDAIYPIITRFDKNSSEIRNYNNSAFKGVLLVLCPILAIFIYLASELVLLVYGPNWTSTIPLLTAIFIWCFCISLIGVISKFILASDHHKTVMYIDLISMISMVLVLYFALPNGIDIYVKFMALQSTLMVFIILILAFNKKMLDPIKTLKSFYQPILCTSISLSFTYFSLKYIYISIDVIKIFAGFALIFLSYLFFFRILFKNELIQIVNFFPKNRYITRLLFIRY